MIGALVAAGLAANVDWRRLVILAFALALPIPASLLVVAYWWRRRPGVSYRAPAFCDAVSTELRAGASIRTAVELAAASVDAHEVLLRCRLGAPMGEIAAATRHEFAVIGEELNAVLARSERMSVSPAALFDELGSIALAELEVAHEVATASAPAKATGAVLLIAPITAIILTASRSGFDPFLTQPAQRASALVGLGLAIAGIVASGVILRRAT